MNPIDHSPTLISPYNMQSFDADITQLYDHAATNSAAKLKTIANFFLYKPYVLEPLGEGIHAIFSQQPLYRTDQFDCVTYVDTVLALHRASTLAAFKENILRIRYRNAMVDYRKRTDWFTDLEWIPNAQNLRWLKDITNDIVDTNKHVIAQSALTKIDKPNWYRTRSMKTLQLLSPVPSQAILQQRLTQLHQFGNECEAQASSLTYLPLTKILTSSGQLSSFFTTQLPAFSIIIIVRPNWNIRDHFPGYPNGYGTNLNVSHLGLCLRDAQQYFFYHASSLQQRVVMQPLHDYLFSLLHNDTIKGINIQEIIF